MTLIETIDNEIQNQVPQMIQDAITDHTHNGTDSQSLSIQSLANVPVASVATPTTGTTQDTLLRAAFSQLVVQLQQLGLLD